MKETLLHRDAPSTIASGPTAGRTLSRAPRNEDLETSGSDRRTRTNMKNVANARFTIKSWDEKPYSEAKDLPKLTRAAVSKTFAGDISGDGHVEYLMMYRSDGSATFVGLERVV